MTVIARTNVPAAPGVAMALYVSSSGAFLASAPQSRNADPWDDKGTIGTLVVTPHQDRDEPIRLRIALGIGQDPALCADGIVDPRCIIARRNLSFLAFKQLKVPVVLHKACIGVACDADTTCNFLGVCVPAAVPPENCLTDSGCVLEGDDTVTGVVPIEVGVKDAGDASEVSVDAGLPKPTLGPVAQLTVQGPVACARFDTGLAECWGRNEFGQLGLGDTRNRGAEPQDMEPGLPVLSFADPRVAQIAHGGNFGCALLGDKSTRCWGYNEQGQLGLGDKLPRGGAPSDMGAALSAVDFGAGRSASSVAVGSFHACALLGDATLRCWGNASFGQLGLGDTNHRGDQPGEMGAALPAVDLGAGRTAKSVALGLFHTCAILDNNSVKCFGRNDFGQLGLGDTNHRGDQPGELGAALPAVDLGAGRTALQLALGTLHTCAVLDDGSVKCWGYGSNGQLGQGDPGDRGFAPNQMGASLPAIDLGPGRTATLLAAGNGHTCAVLDNGSVKCWGFAAYGQLGLGDTQNRGDGAQEMGANLPALDLGAGRVAREIGAGDGHTCARLDDGSVKCWGRNFEGQLGLGDTVSRGGAPGQMGTALPAVRLQ